MSDQDERKPIRPPAADPKREIGRTITEAVVELVPGGNVLTGLYRTTHPPKAEQDREAWQEAISDRTNEHSERLDQHEKLLAPKQTVSGAAAQLIAALARACPDGLGQKRYDLTDLCALLPGLDKQAVADASYELEALGLLRMQRFLGGNWHANLTPFFYEQVDPQLMGWNTAADAMEVARIMLAEDTGNASTLHAKTGWTKRRFNPAFRALLHLFPNGRVRKVIQPDYPTAGVVLAPEDKAALRRFVARGSGG